MRHDEVEKGSEVEKPVAGELFWAVKPGSKESHDEQEECCGTCSGP